MVLGEIVYFCGWYGGTRMVVGGRDHKGWFPSSGFFSGAKHVRRSIYNSVFHLEKLRLRKIHNSFAVI